MKIISNFKRIKSFFWRRKNDLLTPSLWSLVHRVVINRFNFWERVSHEDFQLNLAAIENRPWCIHIETTNICSANCIFCAYQYQTRDKIIMEDSVYQKIIDEYCEMGGGELMLQVLVGDPTVDHKIIDRIKLARSRNEITSIKTITNAILLDKIGIKEFLTSGLTDVMISLAMFDKDFYQKIYRTKQYDRMKNNVTELLRLNDELGNPINITLAFRTNLTLKETLSLPDYQPLKKYKHNVDFNTDYDTWLGEIKQEDLLDGMSIRPLSVKDNESCILFYEGPIIFSDGKVGLCSCRDYNADSEVILGDIKTEKLIDIWHNKKFKDIRENFKKGIFPEICEKCTHYVNLDFYRTRKGNKRRKILESLRK